MNKYELVYANYNEETGKSTVQLMDEYGMSFWGHAYLLKEDVKYGSKFFGCDIAKMRAQIDMLRYDLTCIKNHLNLYLDVEKAYLNNPDIKMTSHEKNFITKQIQYLQKKKKQLMEQVTTAYKNLDTYIEVYYTTSKNMKDKKE